MSGSKAHPARCAIKLRPMVLGLFDNKVLNGIFTTSLVVISFLNTDSKKANMNQTFSGKEKIRSSKEKKPFGFEHKDKKRNKQQGSWKEERRKAQEERWA